VVFVCHIENGKDLLSIDELGHIFIWRYEPEYLVSATQMYRPAHKYRVSLRYNLFKMISQQVVKTGK